MGIRQAVVWGGSCNIYSSTLWRGAVKVLGLNPA